MIYKPIAITFPNAVPEIISKFGSDLDLSKGEPHICTLNPEKADSVCYGKVVGWQWYEGKVILRADFDPEKGAHFNFEDNRPGKAIERVVPLEGGVAAVEEFLASLNTPEALARILAILREKMSNQAFKDAHPQKVSQYAKWIKILTGE